MNKAESRKAVCAELARLLAEERERQAMSRNKLATLTGLNQSTVSRLESDPDNPTLDSLLRIADALKVDLGKLLSKATRRINSAVK